MTTLNLDIPRKALDVVQVLSSVDSGGSWSTDLTTYDSVQNQITKDVSPTDIVVVNSVAYARQTKPSTDQSVFNGEAGVGSVTTLFSYHEVYGALLGESLIQDVFTDSRFQEARLTNNMIQTAFKEVVGGKQLSDVAISLPAHSPITFGDPRNSSVGVKTLTTQLNVNDQASIQFQYEELVHNGTDWGDDGKMYITTTGDSTNTDENGTVVKCGVHELAVPYGWIKNEV